MSLGFVAPVQALPSHHRSSSAMSGFWYQPSGAEAGAGVKGATSTTAVTAPAVMANGGAPLDPLFAKRAVENVLRCQRREERDCDHDHCNRCCQRLPDERCEKAGDQPRITTPKSARRDPRLRHCIRRRYDQKGRGWLMLFSLGGSGRQPLDRSRSTIYRLSAQRH